ncbi:MAG: calcium-binding protein [Pseudoruegeria sp.]
MTTYTIAGISVPELDTDLTLETTLKVVVPDKVDGFTYEILVTDTSGLAAIELQADVYHVYLGDKDIDLDSIGTDYLPLTLEISWDSTEAAQLLIFGDAWTNDLYFFEMGGDTVPWLDETITDLSVGAISSGSGFFAGDFISFAEFPNVSISEDDVLFADITMVQSDSFSGGIGNDVLFGFAGKDILFGGKGSDMLYGGKGMDVLVGGKGRDVLSGDEGKDTLTGGKHADTFVFGKGDGKDTITDFTDNVDTIQLEEALWGGDLSKKKVLNKFAEVDGDDIVLDFGKHELRIEDFTDIDALKNDLELV